MAAVVNVKKKALQILGYRDFKEWDECGHTLYIGRNMCFYVPGTVKSKWANPYSAKKYGREKCLEMYREYITNSDLIKDIYELEGKELGCWCKPEACHGDILINLLRKEKKRL